MLKRATWLTVGFGLGVGTTVATARRVRRRLDRYQPRALADRVATTAQTWRDQLAAALDEGRAAMYERESELLGDPSRPDARA